MTRHLLLLLLLAFSTMNFAQVVSYPVNVKNELVREADSLTQKFGQPPDTLLTYYSKIDSIGNIFNHSADSIQTQYQNSISKIDFETRMLKRRIDSLQHLGLPTEPSAKALNNLDKTRHSKEKQFTDKLNSLKSKTTDKLNSLDFPPEHKEPLQKLMQNVNDMKLNNDIVTMPSLDIPSNFLPEIGIDDLTAKSGEIGNVSNLGNLPKIETPAGDIGNLTPQAQGYHEDIKNITGGNPNDVQQLPETIEEQASKIDGMGELQKQSGIIDEHKAKLEDFKDPDAAKEKAVEVAKEAAVDHFAGKQEQLKAAMDKISKYKQKYSSVSSIKDLPKRPPNPMKGKPFVERLIPGLYLQYQQKNFYLLDVNPYIGYKLTGRFSTGLGWNHRVAYDSKHKIWNKRARIFGPRGYVDFKLGKGFIAHVEGESMNSFVPSTIHGNPDAGHREWVWSFMTGIKKEYRIYKNLKGTALIQYNLFNRYYKAPYVDRLNSRVGFEYILKKKKR